MTMSGQPLAIVLLCFSAMMAEAGEAAPDPVAAAVAQLETARQGAMEGSPATARLDRAITALRQVLSATAVQEAASSLISDKDIRRIFNVPAVIKDGRVTLVYNFAQPKEMVDWIVEGDAPTKENNALVIPALTTLRHKAVFQGTADVRGELAMGLFEGKHVMIGDLELTCSNYNAWSINILQAGRGLGSDLFDKRYTVQGEPKAFHRFSLSIADDKARMTCDNAKVASTITAIRGNIALYGGKGDNRFRSIVVSGIPDPTWMATEVQILNAKANK